MTFPTSQLHAHLITLVILFNPINQILYLASLDFCIYRFWLPDFWKEALSSVQNETNYGFDENLSFVFFESFEILDDWDLYGLDPSEIEVHKIKHLLVTSYLFQRY